MIPTLTCLALACVGTDLGYQPAANGGLELIVQVDPATFQSLRPNDPISLAVRPEAQKVPPSQITLVLGNESLPHRLPPMASSPPNAPIRRGLAEPSTAPEVLPTMAAMPLSSASGPALGPSSDQGPTRVPRPGASRSEGERPPSSASQQYSGGSANLAGNRTGMEPLPPVDGGNTAKSATMDSVRLLLILTVIALAACNGYVGWLFYDARQRYLGLLSRTFAAAK